MDIGTFWLLLALSYAAAGALICGVVAHRGARFNEVIEKCERCAPGFTRWWRPKPRFRVPERYPRGLHDFIVTVGTWPVILVVVISVWWAHRGTLADVSAAFLPPACSWPTDLEVDDAHGQVRQIFSGEFSDEEVDFFREFLSAMHRAFGSRFRTDEEAGEVLRASGCVVRAVRVLDEEMQQQSSLANVLPEALRARASECCVVLTAVLRREQTNLVEPGGVRPAACRRAESRERVSYR